MSKKSFTDAQEREVIDMYVAGSSIYEIAEHFHVSTRPVCRVIDQTGLKSKQQQTEERLTPEVREDIALACASGAKIDDVAAIHSIGRRTVTKILSDFGIVARTGRPPSCELNHGAFDDMRDPAAAYWAGFLFADGSVIPNDKYGSPKVELGLSQRDHEHVEKFRKFLGSTHKICTITSHVGREDRFICGRKIHSGPTSNLHVRSSRLVENLVRHGMVEIKSERTPSTVLEDSRDFWRGMVDGDGTVSRKTDGNPYISLNGQHAIVDAFIRFLRRRSLGDRINPNPHDSIFTTSSYGTEGIQVIRLLYRGAQDYLSRKYREAEIILRS